MEARRTFHMVPGLTIMPDFISIKEEKDLLDFVNKQRWRKDLGRRVQHYGYRYDYGTRKPINDVEDIPEIFNAFIDRLIELELWTTERPTQMIVNEYKSGQGITAHVDHVKWFGPQVATISMGIQVPMEFKRGSTRACTVLKPRSVAVMSEAARYKWSHSISPQKRDGVRISITLHRPTPSAMREMGVLPVAHNQQEHRMAEASEGSRASPVVTTLGDAPIVVEDSPPPPEEGTRDDPIDIDRKRKADDDGDAPAKKLEGDATLEYRASPTSPPPADAGPPEASPNAGAAADAVPTGSLMELDFGIYERDPISGDVNQKTHRVMTWVPDRILDHHTDKPFAKGKPLVAPKGEYSEYTDFLLSVGYDLILHVLMVDIPDGWEMTGDVIEPNDIHANVPANDPRIRLLLTDPIKPKCEWITPAVKSANH